MKVGTHENVADALTKYVSQDGTSMLTVGTHVKKHPLFRQGSLGFFGLRSTGLVAAISKKLQMSGHPGFLGRRRISGRAPENPRNFPAVRVPWVSSPAPPSARHAQRARARGGSSVWRGSPIAVGAHAR